MPLTVGSSLTSASTAAMSGPVGAHLDGDHLDAEGPASREVTVVAGHRADEGDPLLLRPGPRGVDTAVEQEVDDRRVHHGQARVAADDDLRRARTQSSSAKISRSSPSPSRPP